MKGKKILFICPMFFGYEIAIKKALIENGALVDYFDERPSNNSFLKAIFRTRKSLLKYQIENYYNHIYNKIITKEYDYFFVIKGEVVTESFITKFKEANPKTKLVFYTFDSMKNNKSNSTLILKYFDVCYSFDFEDVKSFPFLKLKHLFYTSDFINKSSKNKVYDISFVGTMHSNRFPIIKQLFSHFKNIYLFCYMPAKWFFYFEKFTKKEFKEISLSDVSFSKLKREQVAEIFKLSKSVLDIQRFGQSGLTMRTFEVLAAGAILITTNSYIKQVEFYNQNNIILLEDLESLDKIQNIVQYVQIPQKSILVKEYTFDKYYINNWVTEFFR